MIQGYLMSRLRTFFLKCCRLLSGIQILAIYKSNVFFYNLFILENTVNESSLIKLEIMRLILCIHIYTQYIQQIFIKSSFENHFYKQFTKLNVKQSNLFFCLNSLVTLSVNVVGISSPVDTMARMSMIMMMTTTAIIMVTVIRY